MAKVNLTPALRAEYEDLFKRCVTRPEREQAVEAILGRLLPNRARYEAVERSIGVPWYVVAVIHNMESDMSFSRHLHNGDPLTARTVHVPAGRPKAGQPPFTWEESAADALTSRKLSGQVEWSLPGTLYEIEGYNGWGYRRFHPHVLSPYLWSFSTAYTSGKYVADGTWSDTAVSKQCGAAVVLRRLAEQGTVTFPDHPAPAPDQPLVVPFSMHRSPDPAVVARAETLQRWLNTHTGIFVKVDGVPGRRTSDAFRAVTGSFLPDDPQA